MCLEIGSKPEEAIPYCQNAISVCKSRVQRLKSEVKNLSKPVETPALSEAGQIVQPSSSTSLSGDPLADKEAEIETLTGLCGDLEKKVMRLTEGLILSRPYLTFH